MQCNREQINVLNDILIAFNVVFLNKSIIAQVCSLDITFGHSVTTAALLDLLFRFINPIHYISGTTHSFVTSTP